MKIAVVGCGAAGAAVGIFLRRAGHEVIGFEQAAECRAVGAGFLLQPSGMEVLRELGIHDEVISHASQVRRLHVVEKDGRDLIELRYEEIGAGLFGAGLHRPVVMGALIGLAEREGAEIRRGVRVESARRRGDKWEVEGETFDLLLVADGARSAMRRMLLGEGYDRGYGWGAHWFIGKNHGVFPEGDLHQVVCGTRRLAGFLPTGRAAGGTEDLVSLFWSIEVKEDGKIRGRPLDEWKENILELCPMSEDLLGQIAGWAQVLTARYGDVRMRRWHGDRVVYLGDAGHAMSPQLGQGVNLALEDASCLARCLREMTVERALPEYTRRRRPVLRYYQFATRWLTPVFQSDHEWISPLRHGAFRASQRIGVARRLMTLSMAGRMRGWMPGGL